MPFNKDTVPDFSVKEICHNTVEIIEENHHHVLYVDGEKWMVVGPGKVNKSVKELFSSYDLAHGEVIISGLGFGILALWLCNKPEVSHVTVLEVSKDVIDVFKASNAVPHNMTILECDASKFVSSKKYDCLFLDHYEKQRFDWRIKNMKQVCKNINHNIFWSWSLEHIYLFKKYQASEQLNLFNKNIFTNIKDFSAHWNDFVLEYFPDEVSLLQISNQKVNEYVHTYFNEKYF
jgi:hypothetical protein